MAATPQSTYRLPARTIRQLDELAVWWGPVQSLSRAGAIAEAVDRAWKAEERKRTKKPTAAD